MVVVVFIARKIARSFIGLFISKLHKHPISHHPIYIYKKRAQCTTIKASNPL
jgi:hypothetical protein